MSDYVESDADHRLAPDLHREASEFRALEAMVQEAHGIIRDLLACPDLCTSEACEKVRREAWEVIGK